MSRFNIRDCAIPVVWCGLSDDVPKYKVGDKKVYKRTGTRVECMRAGFGAGTYTERNKKLPKNSLKHIRYIGDQHELSFKRDGIHTSVKLRQIARTLSKNKLSGMLRSLLRTKTDKLDKRAYNSVILYLHSTGVSTEKLPRCSKIN